MKFTEKSAVAFVAKFVSSTWIVASTALVRPNDVGPSSKKLMFEPIFIDDTPVLLSPSLSTIVTSLVRVIRESVIVALTSLLFVVSE